MADDQRHPQAAGLADPSILKRILDAGHDQVTRTIQVAKRNLGNKIGAQTLGTVVTSTAGSVRDWMNLVVAAMRRPTSFRLEVQPRPLWMHILAALVLVPIFLRAMLFFSAVFSAPPVPTAAHDLQEATMTPNICQYQAPGPSPIQTLYTPDETGVVAEICFLLTGVSTQTARAPGAQTLYEFLDSRVGSGAARSDASPRRELCQACLTSEARRSAISESGGAIVLSELEEEEEELLQTLERSSILISDPTSRAIYERLFVEPSRSEGHKARLTRISSLCMPFWR